MQNNTINRLYAWAESRGILANSTGAAQFKKTREEFREFWYELYRPEETLSNLAQRLELARLELADVAVTLLIQLFLDDADGVIIPEPDEDEAAVFTTDDTVIGLSIILKGLGHCYDRHEDPTAWLRMALRKCANIAHYVLKSDLRSCLDLKLEILESRSGRMVDGIFVKDN